MLYCNSCTEIFSYDDAEKYQEEIGEFWGSPAYQTFCRCPYCGSNEVGDYEEVDDG